MKSYLEEKREDLVKRRQYLLTGFTQMAELGDDAQLGLIFEDIRFTNEFIATLDRVKGENRSDDSEMIPQFIVSSLFLHESFKKLTADQDEQFVFITGPEVDGVFVLDQMLDFQHEKRNFMGVLRRSPEVTRLCFLRMTPRAVIAFCEWSISRAKDPSEEARDEKAGGVQLLLVSCFPLLLGRPLSNCKHYEAPAG